MLGAAEGAGEEEAATGELWHKLKFKQTRRRGGKSRLPHPHNLRISLSVSLFWRLSSPLSPRPPSIWQVFVCFAAKEAKKKQQQRICSQNKKNNNNKCSRERGAKEVIKAQPKKNSCPSFGSSSSSPPQTYKKS